MGKLRQRKRQRLREVVESYASAVEDEARDNIYKAKKDEELFFVDVLGEKWISREYVGE